MDDRPLALQSIYVRNSSTYMADDFHPNVDTSPLQPLFRTEREVRIEQHTGNIETSDGDAREVKWCAFQASFRFIYVRPKEGGEKFASDEEIEAHVAAGIKADIVATYAVHTAEFPPQERLQIWMNRNVHLHVWPYWREFCHNALLRMGLPVTLIPLASTPPSMTTPTPAPDQ